MSQLTPAKVNFLLTYKDKLSSRGFLIDVMTQVEERPIIYCSNLELPTPEKQTIELKSNDWKDNTMKWLSSSEDSNELTVVPDIQDPYILFNVWRNFELMTEQQQEDADMICIANTGKTNREHAKTTLRSIHEANKDDILKSIIGRPVILTADKGACICYCTQIRDEDDNVILTFQYLDGNATGRLFGETDTFNIKKGDSPNYTKNTMEETTVGRFLMNYCILGKSFGSKIAYINGPWNLSKIEEEVSHGILDDTITIDEFKAFQNRLFFYGHFTELCVPAFSRKSLGTDPSLAAKKKELLERFKGRLTEPEVIKEFEDTLIAMDKEYLKDDTSLRFYTPLGKKSFDIHRKKMYLTVGGIESFSKGTTSYTFIDNSLAEGWDKNAFPAICNEIRKGVFDRGHETQLGGAQTKYIVRVFQDTVINEDDCGTIRYIDVDFNRVDINKFIGHYVLPENEPITQENKTNYINKVVKVRSALKCQNKTGFCYKCIGERFKQLNSKMTNMYAVDVSSTFLTGAMKNMHGTKLELMQINNLEDYVI